MRRVFKKDRWVIYKTDCGYIVQNILMPDFAHTHLESFNVAKRILFLSYYRKLPHDLSPYLLISLLRVNNDEKYCSKIQELLNNKKPKDKYKNRRECNVKGCN